MITFVLFLQISIGVVYGCTITINTDLNYSQPLLLNLNNGDEYGVFFSRDTGDEIKLLNGEVVKIVCPDGNVVVGDDLELSSFEIAACENNKLKINGKEVDFVNVTCTNESFDSAEKIGKIYSISDEESEETSNSDEESEEISTSDEESEETSTSDEETEETSASDEETEEISSTSDEESEEISSTSDEEIGETSSTSDEEIGETSTSDEETEETPSTCKNNKFTTNDENDENDEVCNLGSSEDVVNENEAPMCRNVDDPESSRVETTSINWKDLEADIEKYFSSPNEGFGVCTGQSKPTSDGNKLLWKLIYKISSPQENLGIVFIVVPYGDNVRFNTASDVICNDICDQYNWLRWDRKNIAKGYGYCCEFNDFKDEIDNPPNDIVVNGLLNIGCTITINKDLLQKRQPLLLKSEPQNENDLNIFLLPEKDDKIILRNENRITFACPGGNIKIRNQVQLFDFVTATCRNNKFEISGESNEVSFFDITCADKLQGFVEPDIQTNIDSYKRKDICFKFKNRNRINLIEVYFDSTQENILYSKFTLTKTIAGFQSGVQRPNWDVSGFPNSLNINNLNNYLNRVYKKENQQSIINQQLHVLPENLNKYISITSDLNLSRGHLTAKADFLYGAQQDLTFYYINSAPQWQSFNGGNWNDLENDIRRFVSLLNEDLIVYTGTYDVTTLPSHGEHISLVLCENNNNCNNNNNNNNGNNGNNDNSNGNNNNNSGNNDNNNGNNDNNNGNNDNNNGNNDNNSNNNNNNGNNDNNNNNNGNNDNSNGNNNNNSGNNDNNNGNNDNDNGNNDNNNGNNNGNNGNNNNNLQIPVPRLFWKILHHPTTSAAIVFVGVNNPYFLNRATDVICDDICSEDNGLKWDSKNIEKGYSYCCTYENLKQQVTTPDDNGPINTFPLPQLTATRLLTLGCKYILKSNENGIKPEVTNIPSSQIIGDEIRVLNGEIVRASCPNEYMVKIGNNRPSGNDDTHTCENNQFSMNIDSVRDFNIECIARPSTTKTEKYV